MGRMVSSNRMVNPPSNAFLIEELVEECASRIEAAKRAHIYGPSPQEIEEASLAYQMEDHLIALLGTREYFWVGRAIGRKRLDRRQRHVRLLDKWPIPERGWGHE